MDLLDSFGDWMQLAFTIAWVRFLIPLVATMVPYSKWITPLVFAGTYWTQFYDYDLILGVLLGSVWLIYASEKRRHYSQAHGIGLNTELWEDVCATSLRVGVAGIVVSLLKMLLFW